MGRGRSQSMLAECGSLGSLVGVPVNTTNNNTLMTHETDTKLLSTVLQLITENGTEGLLECFRMLLNEAMRQERSQVLRAEPYERTEARLGHANGFKDKTLNTRLGSVELQIPQVRGDVEFYPNALEKGLRSEQALNLALAEMYVQGVST